MVENLRLTMVLRSRLPEAFVVAFLFLYSRLFLKPEIPCASCMLCVANLKCYYFKARDY